MKALKIEIGIDNEGKIGTAIKSQGFDSGNMSDQLEILGILENLKNVQQQRIIKLEEIQR